MWTFSKEKINKTSLRHWHVNSTKPKIIQRAFDYTIERV